MRYFIYMMMTLFFVSGCATKTPAVTQYALVLQGDKYTQTSSCKGESLKVLKSFSDTTLMDTKMYYASGLEVNNYHQSQWVRSPNTMVSEMLLQNIRNAHLFQSVVGYNSRVQTKYVLESRLDEFMQYFSNDMKRSYVVVQLSLALVRKEGLDLVKAKTFRTKVDVTTLNASGGVQALEGAMQKVMHEVVIWLSGACNDK